MVIMIFRELEKFPVHHPYDLHTNKHNMGILLAHHQLILHSFSSLPQSTKFLISVIFLPISPFLSPLIPLFFPLSPSPFLSPLIPLPLPLFIPLPLFLPSIINLSLPCSIPTFFPSPFPTNDIQCFQHTSILPSTPVYFS